MILCLWPPLHPLSKLLVIQGHAQNLKQQLWIGGRREVSIISHEPVTSSDLKHERLFFRESVSTFLQLVVANRPWQDWKPKLNYNFRAKCNNSRKLCSLPPPPPSPLPLRGVVRSSVLQGRLSKNHLKKPPIQLYPYGEINQPSKKASV